MFNFFKEKNKYLIRFFLLGFFLLCFSGAKIKKQDFLTIKGYTFNYFRLSRVTDVSIIVKDEKKIALDTFYTNNEGKFKIRLELNRQYYLLFSAKNYANSLLYVNLLAPKQTIANFNENASNNQDSEVTKFRKKNSIQIDIPFVPIKEIVDLKTYIYNQSIGSIDYQTNRYGKSEKFVFRYQKDYENYLKQLLLKDNLAGPIKNLALKFKVLDLYSKDTLKGVNITLLDSLNKIIKTSTTSEFGLSEIIVDKNSIYKIGFNKKGYYNLYYKINAIDTSNFQENSDSIENINSKDTLSKKISIIEIILIPTKTTFDTLIFKNHVAEINYKAREDSILLNYNKKYVNLIDSLTSVSLIDTSKLKTSINKVESLTEKLANENAPTKLKENTSTGYDNKLISEEKTKSTKSSKENDLIESKNSIGQRNSLKDNLNVNRTIKNYSKSRSSKVLDTTNYYCPICFNTNKYSQLVSPVEMDSLITIKNSDYHFSDSNQIYSEKNIDLKILSSNILAEIRDYGIDTIQGFSKYNIKNRLTYLNNSLTKALTISDSILVYSKLYELLFDYSNLLKLNLKNKSLVLNNFGKLALKHKILLREIEIKYIRSKISDLEKRLIVVNNNSNINKIKFIFTSILLLIAIIALLNLFRNKNKIGKLLYKTNTQFNEIQESITYAKRLQLAILPSNKFLNEIIKDSFVIYLPKDIVAGDFYWIDVKNNEIYLAVCDCTGHGVPGSLISMICNSALSRAINEIGERQPGRIFDKCRDLVIESFSKSTDEVQDGMDASLGMINLETRTLKWAGANSPLWIYRSNLKCIEIVLPDKQPIGKVDSPKSFTTRTFQLNENDVVYLFTDGYADQFGGSKNKKLTKKKFQEFLLSIADKSLDVQKIMLIDFHNSYKGNLEQVDDICVIGFKLT